MIQHFLGAALVITGFISRAIGEPSQILLNWRRKSCEGIDLLRYATQFSTFVAQVLYSIFGNPDPYFLFVATLGVLGTGTVLAQMWLYRRGSASI